MCPKHIIQLFQIQDGAQNMEQNGRYNAKFEPKWTNFDIKTVFKLSNIIYMN